MDLSFQPVISRIREAGRILILSHERPDGDAIGSSLGLGLLLEQLGKSVQIVNRDPVPDALRFLPRVSLLEGVESITDCDLVIALDSAGRDRIGAAVWERVSDAVDVVNIDHHISNPGYGTLNYVDTGAPATGQLICRLAAEAGWDLSQDAATHLYAAISTDTGSFRYPSTSAETMRMVADLIDAGVDVGTVNQELYESYPMRRVEALSFLLKDLRMDCGERCASVSLSLEASAAMGLRPGDTEGVIDVIRAIDTVIVSVFFEELEDGRIRVSSRSKSTRVSVGEICASFGGGGHTLAAGARLPGPLEEAADAFLGRVCHTIDEIEHCKEEDL